MLRLGNQIVGVECRVSEMEVQQIMQIVVVLYLPKVNDHCRTKNDPGAVVEFLGAANVPHLTRMTTRTFMKSMFVIIFWFLVWLYGSRVS